jgi:PAS domain S-box-containing protein
MDDTKAMVLIVEDDAGLIELLNDIIQQNGYQTCCVTSAKDALVWLKTATPDLILLDYSLPDLSGKEFVNILKSESGVVPPFVVVTGRGDERTAVEMMKLGARDYIVKDSHFLEMIQLVVSKICMEIQKENTLKRTQDALIESYAFNNQIIESAQEGIVLYSLDLVVLKWNRFMEKITGSSAADIIGKNLNDAFPHRNNVGLAQTVAKAIRGEEVAELEFVFNHAVTNEIVWVADVVSALKNTDGEIIGAISTVRDITEKKRAEREVQKSNAEFKDLFDNAPIGYHEIDIEGRITRMNKTELDMLGYTFDEINGKYIWDLVVDRKKSKQITTEKLSGRQHNSVSFEREFIKKDGMTLSVLVLDKFILSNNGEITGIRSSVQDITERKNAEAEVLKISDHYQALIEKSPAGFVLLDKAGEFKYFSPTAFRMFGYSPDEAFTLHPDVLTHPADLAMVLENLGRLIQDPSFIPVIEYRFKHKNGDWRWIESTFSNQLDDSAVEAIVLNFRDIQERREAEEALKESEELYRNLVYRIPDGVYKSTPAGRFLDVNPAMVQMLGYDSKEDLMSINIISDLYFDKSERDALLMNHGSTLIAVFRMKKKDGSEIWVEDHGWLNTDAQGNIASHEGVLRDITERKYAEETLISTNSLLNATLESTADGLLVVDVNGKTAIYNQKFVELWGIPSDLLEEKIDEQMLMYVLTQLENPTEFINKVNFLYKNQELSSVDDIKLTDGRVFERYSIPQWVNRTIVGRVWSFRDITDRKNIENIRIQSETKFRSITEQTKDFISIANDQGQIIYSSPASYGLFQLKPDEMIGRNFIEFVAEYDISRALTVFKGHLDGPSAKNLEFSLKRKDGSVFIGDLNKSELMLDNEPVVLVVIRDISERIVIEKALRESEANLSEALVISNLGFWEYHALTDMFEFNDQFYAVYNTSSEEQGGYMMSSAEYLKRFVHPDDTLAVEIEISKLLASVDLGYHSRIVHRIVCGDGSIKCISVNIRVNEVLNGILIRAVGANQDITEMKKNEDLLAKSEMFFRQSQKAGNIGSYNLSLRTGMWESSEVMDEIFGINDSYERSITGWSEIVAPEDREMMSRYFSEYVLGQKKPFDKEYRIQRISDGEIRWVFGRGELIIENDIVVSMVGTILDISERKEAENQLKDRMQELVRFHNLTVDRELSMIELKKEVNSLQRKMGNEDKYRIVE